ncbi:hypothetical protein [Marivivens marinus]|uniref:hypothetical protein n=1 Tax=Marivivens marinus TaxID=3110173 RepID=UPI003B847C34
MRYVTKFLGEHGFAAAQQGSFKFGTLEEYRSSESGHSRMSDDREGVATEDFQFTEGRADDVTIGGIRILNCNFEGNKIDFRRETQSNAFVACCSFGPYDRSTHIKIIKGQGEYQGNDDLGYYVVYDLGKLSVALHDWAARNFRCNVKLRGEQVRYAERAVHEEIGVIGSVPSQPSRDAIWNAIFVKPRFYSIENEFRFALFPEKLDFTNGKWLSIFAESRAIQSAICQTGRI